MMKLNKKGVSPLIATVLLIAFAVALGAVVMNWGRAYVEDTANFAQQKSDTEIKCITDAKLDFLTIDGVRKVCFNSSFGSTGAVHFIVQNTGTAQVTGLTLTAITEDGIDNKTIAVNLSRSGLFKAEMNFTTATTSVQTFRIIPQIKIQGKDTLCPKNELVEDSPLTC